MAFGFIIDLIKLVLLYTVIVDPLASFSVFFVATAHMTHNERIRTATLAIVVATALSFVVLIFGQQLLVLFSTTIDDFKVAGGLILGILGIKMALGGSVTDLDTKHSSARAIAAIIATPLLTGPATITSIIITTKEFGMILTGLALLIVLAATAILFYQADRLGKKLSMTVVQVVSTILGLITLSWAVKFIREGLGI
jgi:multiple antibiotic resistance protein